MATWTIKGHLDIIDKFGKLHFSYLEDDITKNRFFKYLKRPEGSLLPYNDTNFWIVPPRVDDEMRSLVGVELVLEVKPVDFCLNSKFQHHKVEVISGIKFKLIGFKKLH